MEKRILIITVSLFFVLTACSYGQIVKTKNYFPIWTFHQDSINIHGISIGLWSLNNPPRFTNTNGIKFELIGIGMFLPLIPQSPIVNSDSAYLKLKIEPLSEKINGLNLSTTGTVCHCLTNGLTASFFGQINYQVNGVSTAFYVNFTQKHNGIMAAFINEAYYINGLQFGLSNKGYNTNGLQIGLLNKSKKLRGIQIGLWNINQKRKFPLINWNFKKD